MGKMHFPLAIVLALSAAGCAQTPLRNSPTLAADAARYHVSRQLLLGASNAGYHPTRLHGVTYFCTERDRSFSYIPKLRCLGVAQMASRLRVSAASVNALRRRISQMPAPRPGQN